MSKKVCVYSSSSDAIEKIYFDSARQLGKMLAENNHTLIYGGASVGLMGEVAKAIHDNGGKVIGIIPEGLNDKGITYNLADELVVTKDMRERKARMEVESDAFVVLPGGFGTLEEALEILTLKQLSFHNKAVVFINTNGYYDKLIDMFEQIYSNNFAKEEYKKMYHITSDVAEAVSYIENYTPPKLIPKWYKR